MVKDVEKPSKLWVFILKKYSLAVNAAVHIEATRSSGEVVWRCANRDKIFKESSTVRDIAIKQYIVKLLSVSEYDDSPVKDTFDTITVDHNGLLNPTFR